MSERSGPARRGGASLWILQPIYHQRQGRFSDNLEFGSGLGGTGPDALVPCLETLPDLQMPCECALSGPEIQDNLRSRYRRPLRRNRKIDVGTH
jgi:hypothetical protein